MSVYERFCVAEAFVTEAKILHPTFNNKQDPFDILQEQDLRSSNRAPHKKIKVYYNQYFIFTTSNTSHR